MKNRHGYSKLRHFEVFKITSLRSMEIKCAPYTLIKHLELFVEKMQFIFYGAMTINDNLNNNK